MENNNKIEGSLNFGNNTPNNTPNNYVEKVDHTEHDLFSENIDNHSLDNTKDSLEKVKEDDNKILENTKTTTTQTQSNNQPDSHITKQIEDVLMDDLSSIYDSLNENDKIKFKQDEHETALKIVAVIKSTKNNIKKAIKSIFKIIYRWISSLKNIKNRAFIEKITKIKVDKILKTQEEDLNK